MGTTAEKLNKLYETKADIKAALQEQGQNPTDVFSTYGGLVRAIQTGVELPALTNPASASEVGEGYDAINAAGERMVGTGELAVNLAPELTAQDTLIADIMTALEGKAAGGGSGSATQTVTIKNGGYTAYYIAADNSLASVAYGETVTAEVLGGLIFGQNTSFSAVGTIHQIGSTGVYVFVVDSNYNEVVITSPTAPL